MKKSFIKNELRREVKNLLPDNMVAQIKQHDIKPEKVKNISVIHEKNKHSLIPLIASCMACLVICCALFLPMAFRDKDNTWLSDQRQEQQQEQDKESSTEK